MKREYIEIEMDGKPFKVRVISYGDKSRKTLVYMHGILNAACLGGRMVGILAKDYRLVLFDNCNWGLSTRT